MRYTRSFLATACFVVGLSQSSLVGQSTAPQNFVTVTPCRIADTRTAAGGSGPITGGQSQNFTVGGACGIPTSAAAYSLNITVVPPSGGTLTYLTIYPTGQSQPTVSTLNDLLGTIVANAALVPAGTSGQVTIYVSNTTDVIIDTNGYFTDETTASNNSTAVGTGTLTGNTGAGNTAVGYDSLQSPSGSFNTASGYKSLQVNSSGAANTSDGYQALQNNTTGSDNTAVGVDALVGNLSGSDNTSIGYQSLFNTFNGGRNVGLGSGAGYGFEQGGENVAIGYQSSYSGDASYTTAVGFHALYASNGGAGGNYNTAIGYDALDSLASGASNIALGANAGSSLTSTNNNIDIGNTGTTGDSGVIRIGTGGTQSSTYIAGISGVTVTGAAVIVNANGQLGVQSSSIRYKEDVHDMADATDALMELRPVEFRYKQADEDGSKPLQFGLIAEEVAKVYPELVVRGKDGRPDSVQYHQLPAMLLNELQKQQRVIEALQNRIDALEQRQVSNTSGR